MYLRRKVSIERPARHSYCSFCKNPATREVRYGLSHLCCCESSDCATQAEAVVIRFVGGRKSTIQVLSL